jgi:Flp pilus assembly protein TadG
MRLAFLRNSDGAAAVEFGLIAPIVAAVLVGVAITGGTILAYNKMRQAISSGAQYALAVDDDAQAIEDVVIAAWDLPAGATVDVVQACYCADAPTTVTDCQVNCADNDYPQQFITISASRPYTNFGGQTTTLNASQRIRTR